MPTLDKAVAIVTGSCGYNWEDPLRELIANFLEAGAGKIVIIGEPYVARRIGRTVNQYEHVEIHTINPSRYPENLLKIYSMHRFKLFVFAFRANICDKGVIRGLNCTECRGLYIKPSDIFLKTTPLTPVVTIYKGYPEVGANFYIEDDCVCENTRSILVKRSSNVIDLSRDYSVHVLKNILKSLNGVES